MGGTQKIKIRGVNSISGGDQPLIVIDGTPISNANFSGSDQADYGNLAQDINPNDIAEVNVLKGKKLTNIRASGSDQAIILSPPRKMTLEQMMAYMAEDELLEVTPKSLRLRKKLLLSHLRKRAS